MSKREDRPGRLGNVSSVVRRRAWLLLTAALLVFAFAFQGSRGIWEPDEGFYTNVAVGMVHSGDWLIPRLNGKPFLDKPPLVYWSMAAAMELGGVNEWSARTPHALWFVGTALLLGGLAARWWGRRIGLLTAGIYALSLAPFVAAQVVTPDTPLAFAVALAYLLYWRLGEAKKFSSRLGWGALLGLAVGLGALAKGPAILLFVAPMVIHRFVDRRSWRGPFEWATLLAGGLAVLVVLPWYFAVVRALPSAGRYILDNQVIGRLFTAEYARNSGPLDGFKVYLPTLVLGSLPWSVMWASRRLRSRPLPAAAEASAGMAPGRRLLLSLWFWMPLAVLFLARSRLPLYALPLFGPIAMVTAHRLGPALAGAQPSRSRRWFAFAAIWLVVLMGIKVVAADYPNRHDSRRVATRLRQLGVAPSQSVVTVDTHRNGLAFYGYDRLHEVALTSHRYPFYSLPESLRSQARRIASGQERPIVLVERRIVRETVEVLREEGVPVRRRPLVDNLVMLEMAQPGGVEPPTS